MKTKYTPALLILSFFLPGVLYGAEALLVNENDVESVYIYKHNNKENHIYLTSREVKGSMDAINNSKNIGLCKYAVKVWVVVSMKQGVEPRFRINGNTIKENNDVCYELQNSYGTYLYEKAHNN